MVVDTRLKVLQLKLQNKSPEQIAAKLNIRLSDVYKHDTAIKQQMARENKTKLGTIAPDALEDVLTTVTELLPYMEKSVSKVATQSKGLKPLFGDVVENAELVQSLIHKQILLELDKDKPDMAMVERLNNMIIASQKAFFNKDGIQVVNMINDGTSESASNTTAATLQALKEQRAKYIRDKEVIDVSADEVTTV